MAGLQDIGARLVLEGLSAYTSGMGSAKSANEGVTKSAKDLGDASNTTADKLGGLLKAGAVAAAAAMAALGGELFVAVRAAGEAQAVHAQLAAVLESTGGAAGVTSEQANALADSLSKLSGADDEAVLGAENMLLTFTSIGSDVFPEVSKAVVDMATAMNGGAVPSQQALRDTAIQVGKAMQDPIAGATALRRVGVQLTEAQQDQIKSLMALGDQEGAQKIILAELATEFGHAAEAAGNTFAGRLGRLQTQLGNVQETIGNALLPVLSELAGKAADWVEDAIPKVEDFLGQMGLIKDVIGALVTGQGFDELYDQINKTFGPDTAKLLGDIIDAIAVFARDELPKLISAFNDLKDAVTPVFDTLGELAKDALPLLGQALKKIVDTGADVIEFFKKNELALDALASILAAGLAIEVGILAVALYGVATAAAVAAGAVVLAALPFIAIGLVIAAVVLAAIEIVKHWSLIEAGAKSLEVVLGQAWSNITGAIGSAMAAIGTLITTGWNNITGAVGSALSAIGTLITTGWNNITGAITSGIAASGGAVIIGWNNITGIVGSALAAIGTLITTGWNNFTGAIGSAVAAALAIVTLAWNNITGAIGSAVATIENTFNGLVGALNILNDHFVFILAYLVAAFIKFVDDGVATFNDLASKLPAVVLALGKRLLELVTGWVTDIITLWNSLSDQVTGIETALWNAVVQAVIDFVPRAITAVGDWISQTVGLAQSLTEQWNAVQAKLLADLLTGLSTFASDAFNTVTGWVGQAVGLAQSLTDQWNVIQASLLSSLLAGIVGFAGDAVSTVEGWVGQLLGLQSSLSEQWQTAQSDLLSGLLNGITGFIGDAFNALGTAAAQFEQAGVDMVQGVINGITEAIPNALGAIGKAASDFVAGFKAGLEEHSPSQRMAREVGKPMMEGIAQGIIDGAPEALAAITDVTTQLVDYANSAVIDALGATQDQINATIANYTGTATNTGGTVTTTSPVIDYNSPSGALLDAMNNAMYGSGGIISQIAALPGVSTSRMITADMLDSVNAIIASVNKATGQNFSLDTTLHDLYFDGYGLDSTLMALWQGAGTYAVGGTIPGVTGTPVPIMAHAGELVLSLAQQENLAKAFASLVGGPGAFASRPEVVMLPLGETSRASERASTTYNLTAHYSKWQDEASLRTDLEAVTLLASR